MPLREHFHPPVSRRGAWDRVPGMWPAMMVQSLNPVLPPRYSAGPLVQLGSGVDEYELRVYDNDRDQRLVAAIEIVSPSNKDRPETRREL